MAEAPTGQTLLEILHGAGRQPTDDLVELVRLAQAAHDHRRRVSSSRARGVTRSEALWAAMHVDARVERVMRDAGLDLKRYDEDLGLGSQPLRPEVKDPGMAVDLRRAVDRFLNRHSDWEVIDPVAVAVAIVEDVVDDPLGGSLPQRLRGIQSRLYQVIDVLQTTRSASAASAPAATARATPATVADIDPGELGIDAGAVELGASAEIREQLRHHLTESRAVILVDEPGGPGGGVLYGALKDVAPAAHVLVMPRAGEWDAELLRGPDPQQEWVLWTAWLGSQWAVLGAPLVAEVEAWLAQPGRWFAALCDPRFPGAIDDLQKAKIPTVDLPVGPEGSGDSHRSAVATGSDDDEAAADRDAVLAAGVGQGSSDPDTSELAGGTDTDLVDATAPIPLDQDRLGLKTFVTMLATVIADRETQMPLSIGLFGEWGSGKSTFMGLLRGTIDELGKSDPARYHTEIVSISFNAWHYSDTNLWASLGDTIFGRLTAASSTGADRAARIRDDLTKVNEQRRQLQAATDRAQREVKELEDQIAQSRAQRRVSARDLVSALHPGGVPGALSVALRQIGAQEQGEDLSAFISDVSAGARELADVRRTYARFTRWALLLIVVTAGLLVTWFGLLHRPDVTSALKTAIGSLAVVAAAASTFVAWTRSALKLLLKVGELAQSRSASRSNASLLPQLDRLRDATVREKVLRAQLDDVVKRAGALGSQLAEASPGQRLYRFIAERSGSDDYRGQLSLISTIRKDFEQLGVLMKEWRKEREEAAESCDHGETGMAAVSPDQKPIDVAPRPIDRIVLYIDDLDRCSPSQVVQVLQAVHLLLALDLFVVVVGVDPRWLLQSLRSQYRQTLQDSHRHHTSFSATPQDYLEKIFTIPFLLPSMTPGSFHDLLRGLADSRDARREQTSPGVHLGTPTKTGEPIGTSSPRAVTRVASGSTAEAGPTAAPRVSERSGVGTGDPTYGADAAQPDPPLETNSDVDAALTGQASRGLALSEEEVGMLAALAPLVGSPRSAKRLLNLYRLLRATRDLTPAASFLGTEAQPGEYRVVAALLGILTGFPDLVPALLAAPPQTDPETPGGLRHRLPSGSWASFVAGLRPRAAEHGWANEVVPNLDETQAGRWSRLVQGLEPLNPMLGSETLRRFQKWEPHVARFSFHLETRSFTGVVSTGLRS